MGDPRLGWTLAALGAAAAGFLRFNLPKASIFMGDVGSTAIGFFLAAVPFASPSRPIPVLSVVLALSLFVLDATTTLVRRVLRGERWFTAHRTHLYQRPLSWGMGHAPITYTAYAGMVLVAAMAAAYPAVEPVVRALMGAAAVALFLAAWLLVRRLELRCSAPER
jgi:UDP-N-acetylmuramyl pentapeptide phosphotransferase/UDP-N-acetylglucosamine-1-phosphate transferase